MSCMKRREVNVGLWSVFCLVAGLQFACAADFTVTTPNDGFTFAFNGITNSPTLTLVRGQTYTFDVNCDTSPFLHIFEILSDGAVNNNINKGTITYTVPMAVSNYQYICSIHGFGGQIITVAPASPPNIRIVGLSVSNNIVLTSTGSNTWSVLPEFNTDLTTTNWFALTVQTNNFANGTNETICGKPPGNTVFIRIRSQPK